MAYPGSKIELPVAWDTPKVYAVLGRQRNYAPLQLERRSVAFFFCNLGLGARFLK